MSTNNVDVEHPELGAMTHGKNIGENPYEKHIYVECPTCKQRRWKQYRPVLLPTKTSYRCLPCTRAEQRRNNHLVIDV